MKPAHLQALFARRREIEYNRIERTEAANKYFDHWGKVTARFENWTAPEYYQQADKQLQKTKEQKEKQKRLQERQQKLTELLTMEKKMHEQELREKEKHPRRHVDTQMLEKINENLKEQQQMRRKLELEAKLYGKWRHGVEDDNLVFESRTDNEVLAKLNWLDKQVNQQLQKEQEQEKAKEREIKLQHELNKTEELQKERQRIREKEIREIRCLQEYHMEQLNECQKETDAVKEKEKQLKGNLEGIEKEIELLEESIKALEKKVDFGQAYNFNKIKVFIRQRSEVFRNQIKLCLSIVERTLDSTEKPETFKSLKKRLDNELQNELQKMSQFEAMYESEAKYSLKRNEELWHAEHKERCELIKHALIEEHKLIKTKLNDIMKKHEELLELKSTHLGVIENSSEKLKHLVQENENAEDKSYHSPHKDKEISHQHNSDESIDNNLSPRCYDEFDCNDINQASNSFNNLHLGEWHSKYGHASKQELEMQKTNAQRAMQVVTPETEAERPRFGRKHLAWN